MDDLSLSNVTLPEVEHFVQELYKPNTPQTISRIQEILQTLQKSPGGWQLADGLLGRPDDNVKFFGALTFTVKLNTESLSDENAISVLDKLISFLITSLKDGSSSLVVRKLCSTLVTYFIHYSHTWSRCVRHLAHCLDSRAFVPVDDIDGTSGLEVAVQSLDMESFIALNWFTQFLANETEKIDSKSTKYIPFYERFWDNVSDVVVFLANGIKPTTDGPIRPEDSIACLQAWIQCAQRNPKQGLVQQYQSLVNPVINCLPNDRSYSAAVELLTFLLDDWHSFLTRDNIESLYSVFESDWGQERYRLLVEGEDIDDEEVQFGLFILAFGNAQVVELMDGTDERAQRVLSRIAGLLSAQGYPGVDNRIFVPALEFFSTFTEDLVDTLYGAELRQNVQWDKQPVAQVVQAVSESWQKIQYPSIDIYASWDSTERLAFAEARKDVGDFLQSVYTIVGQQLISLFAEKLLLALPRSAWAELEAAAFCLGALADCVSDVNPCDDILTKVFGSPLLELLRQGHQVVPVRARQTCLSLIERYSEYFGNHAEFLPAALNLLFSAVGDRHLATSSSKAIFTLCSDCRSILTPEVDAFLEQYSALRNNELDSLAEERVMGAIASIVQAIPETERKANAFQRLLAMIGVDINISLQLASYPDGSVLPPDNPSVLRAFDYGQRPGEEVPASNVALYLSIRALRCLSSTARGFQSPVETPVDLDAEDGVEAPSDPNLSQLHVDIMSLLVRLKDTFSSSIEVVDVICTILRAGFSETEPGPFVFPPEMVTEFMTSRWHSRVATVVNTAGIFIASLSSGSQKGYLPEALKRLLPWVFGLLRQLSEPEQDPDLAQYGLEFEHRVMTRRPEIFMSQSSDMLEFIFMFAIRLLSGNEPLPKAAAIDFWSTFITLKTGNQSTQGVIDNAMTYLGPAISKALILNIGGNASRSELDKLSEPLKKLVVQHVNARRWIEAALSDPEFPSDIVSSEDKELFLKKVLMLRGQRATNTVVRNFWLSCRGADFAYAS
ncbi:hypothetical protein M426DRAFT_317105 [Hypoxylon sp. CI-4A]|nr:hypothetical protein M426DRAFT_317105 [Hypoxylon sp. CI-4A]